MYNYCLNNPLISNDPSGMLVVPTFFHDEYYIENLEGEEFLANYYSNYPNHKRLSGGGGGNYYNDPNRDKYFKSGIEISFEEYYAYKIAPELQLQNEPSIDKGGFIDKGKFFKYMVNHAKNTPV